MRNQLLLAAVCGLILLGARPIFQNTNLDQVHISGKINSKDSIIPITVFYPIDGRLFRGTKEKISVNAKNQFEISRNISKSGAIQLFINRQDVELFIRPGDKLSIHFNLDSTGLDITHIDGRDSEGQVWLNQLNYPDLRRIRARHFKELQRLDGYQLWEQVQQKQNRDLGRLDSLKQINKLSQEFISYLEAKIKYHHAYLFHKITSDVFRRTKMDSSHKNYLAKFPSSYMELWPKLFEEYDMYDEYFKKTIPYRDFHQVVNNQYYRSYLQIIPSKKYKDDSWITDIFFKEFPMVYKGEELEYFFVHELDYMLFRKKFEFELLAVYDTFKTNYTNSKYALPRLEENYNLLQGFHKKQSQDFNIETVFLDSFRFDSVEKIIANIQEPTYIDVWASWCVPCLKEFENIRSLDSLLAEKNIKKLFISIDQERSHDKWLQMIKYFELKGQHARLGNEKTVHKIFGVPKNDAYRLSIPVYALAKNGEIVFNKTFRPSQLDSLSAVIDRFLEK